MELSAANIRYLIAMKENERSDGVIRGVDVARTLGCTRPSVHKMMESLAALGLIRKSSPYAAIRFTPEGSEAAASCMVRYAEAEKKLRGAFPDLTENRNLVCLLLASIPKEQK